MDPELMRMMMQAQAGGSDGIGQGGESGQPAPNTPSQIDTGRILATALHDIKRADEYFKNHIEQKLLERYEVYYADKERYRRLYPRLSEKTEVRAFDLYSAVEGILPNTLKAFFGSNRIISISGNESEDADKAERFMELLQWQLTVKNVGYQEFKSWFGDALATNLGILKCHWKRESEIVPHQETFNAQQLVGVLEDPHNELISVEPTNSIGQMLGLEEPTANVAWSEERYITNQPVIETVRPSDIRFIPDGRTLGECSMVAHRKTVTIDHLRREAKRGIYDTDAVEDIAENNAARDKHTPTELEKKLNESLNEADAINGYSPEPSRIRVVLYECYLKSDINGDGLLEDTIVTVCDGKLLRAVENPYGRAPFFELAPFWDSYQVWGKMGLCEVIQDTQDTHTAIWRQMINALGQSNQWRGIVDQTQIFVEDLIEDRQFIRAKTNPQQAFASVPHPGLNPENFNFLEYCRAQLEEWTGVTRYNQGLDAKSLNKTATGISMIMTASQQRQEEIVRNFAETGIRELYRFLIQLNQRYMDQRQVIRLQNKYMEITPDDIDGDYDLSVDTASGVGAIDSKVQVLTSYLREMFPFAMQIGVAGPDQFNMAAQKLLKLNGIEDADKYVMDPIQMLIQRIQQQMMMQAVMMQAAGTNGGMLPGQLGQVGMGVGAPLQAVGGPEAPGAAPGATAA